MGPASLPSVATVDSPEGPAVTHYGLLLPFRGQAAHMDRITDQISPRVRQHPRQTTYRSLLAAKPGEAAQTYLAGASELMV